MYEMSGKRRGISDNRGSAVVEMSILAPTIIFLTLAVFYSMVYQIDCSIADSVLSEVLIGSADVVKTNGEIESGKFELSELQNRELFYMMKSSYEELQKEAEEGIKSSLEKRLILARVRSVTAQIKNDMSTGEVEIWMDIPIPGISQFIGSKLRRKCKFQAENVNGAESIRRWDEIESLR